jgi:hypothetical protein
VALVDLEIRRMNDEDILVLILKECRCRMAKTEKRDIYREGHKSKRNERG